MKRRVKTFPWRKDLKLNAARCFTRTHATVRLTEEKFVTSGSRVKRVLTWTMPEPEDASVIRADAFIPGKRTPPGRSRSGSMANMNLLTGYEPKYDVDNDTEITPITFPDTDDNEPNLSTDLVSEGDQTKFGSRQAAASAASTVFNPLRVCVHPCTGRPVQREREAVNDLQASEHDFGTFHLLLVLKGLCYGGSEIKARTTVKDRQDLHEFLERQAHTAILGENAAQRKLTEAESDMEIKAWERRNSEFALYESQRELESQRHQLRQASQWAGQAQRERISWCGELELKNRLYQENYTRCRQEFQELRKLCSREERLTQHRLEEHSMQQKRDPDTVSQLLTQIRELQGKEDFLSDAREFHDPESGSSSGQSHVPNQHRIISVP